MEAVNLWTGIALSLLGTWAAAPEALPELGRLARHDAHQLRGWMARFVPWLRRDVTLSPSSAHLGAAFGNVTVSGLMTASGRVVGTVDEQLEQMRKEMDQLRTDLRTQRQEIDARHQELADEIEGVRTAAEARHGELVRRLDEAEAADVHINARAMPVIGLGILLSSGGADLALLPLWANIVVMVLVVAVSVWIVRPIVLNLRRHGRPVVAS